MYRHFASGSCSDIGILAVALAYWQCMYIGLLALAVGMYVYSLYYYNVGLYYLATCIYQLLFQDHMA